MRVSAQQGSLPHVTVPGQRMELTGRLDVHTAADVRLALVDAVSQGTGDLVVDLSAVEALDATGLGVLVGAHRRADRAGRTLLLSDCSLAVSRVLFLTRLEKVLHTCEGNRVA
jgi:anti-sigma B factor antagonist